MNKSELENLQNELSKFAEERNWEQFHTPKNLAMALAGEVGELLAEFQWMTAEESMDAMSSQSASAIQFEVADVFLYLTRLAYILEIDLFAAAKEKMAVNAEKYPPNHLNK